MIALASLVVLLAQAPAAPPTPKQKPVPTGPVLAVETSLGTFKIALFVDEAPLSTENFLKYVRAGFYGGTVFHRVMPRFMIQGGGFTASLQEKPVIGGGVKNEARNGLGTRAARWLSPVPTIPTRQRLSSISTCVPTTLSTSGSWGRATPCLGKWWKE